MQSSRYSSIFAIVVGTLMILMWTFFIVSGHVPEYQTRPAEIVLHLVAEFATAILLIVAGSFALNRAAFAGRMLLIALGMLIYTLLVSPGYYIQKAEYAFVGMFGALLVLALLAVVLQSIRIARS